MDPIREPRTVDQATDLAKEFADLDRQVAEIEADRTASIADVNSRCDRASNELIRRREAAAGKLQAWWTKAGPKLTEGKRKSIELGGCMIGSRAGAVSLGTPENEKAVLAQMLKLRWAKNLLRVAVGFDKKAILKVLEGKRSAELAELGFKKNEAPDTFVLERVEQGGTLGGKI